MPSFVVNKKQITLTFALKRSYFNSYCSFLNLLLFILSFASFFLPFFVRIFFFFLLLHQTFTFVLFDFYIQFLLLIVGKSNSFVFLFKSIRRNVVWTSFDVLIERILSNVSFEFPNSQGNQLLSFTVNFRFNEPIQVHESKKQN